MPVDKATSMPVDEADDDISHIPIVIGVVVAILMIALVVVLAFFLKKRKPVVTEVYLTRLDGATTRT